MNYEFNYWNEKANFSHAEAAVNEKVASIVRDVFHLYNVDEDDDGEHVFVDFYKFAFEWFIQQELIRKCSKEVVDDLIIIFSEWKKNHE